ncbi:MAG: hypothetical protein K0A90_00055 [Methanosarcinaceae archaeon]|nr:hypothetical protein [Methanosarcinaceae archaeon]
MRQEQSVRHLGKSEHNNFYAVDMLDIPHPFIPSHDGKLCDAPRCRIKKHDHVTSVAIYCRCDFTTSEKYCDELKKYIKTIEEDTIRLGGSGVYLIQGWDI